MKYHNKHLNIKSTLPVENGKDFNNPQKRKYKWPLNIWKYAHFIHKKIEKNYQNLDNILY